MFNNEQRYIAKARQKAVRFIHNKLYDLPNNELTFECPPNLGFTYANESLKKVSLWSWNVVNEADNIQVHFETKFYNGEGIATEDLLTLAQAINIELIPALKQAMKLQK